VFTSYQHLLDELPKDVSVVGGALIIYALSMFSTNTIERRSYYLWVAYPDNYFAFRVQIRVGNIWFSIRGQPREFQPRPELPIRYGRGSAYSEFVVAAPEQLAAACGYLARAAELYRLGRNRFSA